MRIKTALPFFLLALALAGLVLFQPGGQRDEPVLMVFSASSFSPVLKAHERLIEERLGIDLVIVEAASSALARQIGKGAPADIFISADVVWLEALGQSGLMTSPPLEIACNALVVAIKEGVVPSPIEGEGFLLPPGWFVTGDPEYVPLGKYALQALENLPHPDDVWRKRLIPAKSAADAARILESGSVQSGILYRTDVLASDRLKVFAEIPQQNHAPILYLAAVLGRENPEKAQKFLAFLKSEEFKTILMARGFDAKK